MRMFIAITVGGSWFLWLASVAGTLMEGKTSFRKALWVGLKVVVGFWALALFLVVTIAPAALLVRWAQSG